MKLIEGKKYNILGENTYYSVKCDSFCGKTCNCSSKELEYRYLFHIRKSKNVRFDDTCGGTEECTEEEYLNAANKYFKCSKQIY